MKIDRLNSNNFNNALNYSNIQQSSLFQKEKSSISKHRVEKNCWDSFVGCLKQALDWVLSFLTNCCCEKEEDFSTKSPLQLSMDNPDEAKKRKDNDPKKFLMDFVEEFLNDPRSVCSTMIAINKNGFYVKRHPEHESEPAKLFSLLKQVLQELVNDSQLSPFLSNHFPSLEPDVFNQIIADINHDLSLKEKLPTAIGIGKSMKIGLPETLAKQYLEDYLASKRHSKKVR